MILLLNNLVNVSLVQLVGTLHIIFCILSLMGRGSNFRLPTSRHLRCVNSDHWAILTTK